MAHWNFQLVDGVHGVGGHGASNNSVVAAKIQRSRIDDPSREFDLVGANSERNVPLLSDADFKGVELFYTELTFKRDAEAGRVSRISGVSRKRHGNACGPKVGWTQSSSLNESHEVNLPGSGH